MHLFSLSPGRRWLLCAASALLGLACSGTPSNVVDATPADASPAIDAAPLLPLPLVLPEVQNDYLGGREDVALLGTGSGAAAADVDGDGDLDLFLARCDITTSQPGGPSLLLRNDSDLGGFDLTGFTSDVLMEFEFTGVCAHAAAFGDYDRDGAVDLFVVTNGPDRLYRNDGNGIFTDVTALAGVAGPPTGVEHSVYWADLNHDGLLDLFVPAHFVAFPPAPDQINANRIYINRGEGSFIEVAASAGAAGDGSSQAAAITDLDGDGDLEIYVANDQFTINGEDPNMFGLDDDSWLDLSGYDEQGLPSYVDRASEYGMAGPRASMGVAVADVDGNGTEDLYVTDWGKNHLHLRAPGTVSYSEEAGSWNVDATTGIFQHYLVGWDARFADLDRDGREELLVAHGMVNDAVTCDDFAQFNLILQREPLVDGFTDITATVGWPTDSECPAILEDRPVGSRGILLADLDNDGDDDVVITPFNEKYRFYRNETEVNDRHALRVVPRGTVSAPAPYGAVLEVTRRDRMVVRRNLYAGGTTTQRYPMVEVALLGADSVNSATLHWPSGYAQRLDLHPDFAVDQTWIVEEPEWLSLNKRVAGNGEDPPELIYRPVDEAGNFLGAEAAGRAVVVTRSDNQFAAVTDRGDGSYSALLPHPGTARTTVVQVSDGGELLRPRLSVRYQ